MNKLFMKLAVLFLLCLAPLVVRAQVSTPAPVAPAPNAAAQPANTSTAQAAYALPPEKLARAQAFSRTEHALTIVNLGWGLLSLWLVLALRGATRLAAWTEGLALRRWLQGLLFFAALLVLLTLLGLPLSIAAHAVRLHYGISVQGWVGWLADQGKSLGVALIMGAPLMLLFNWILRKWPRRFWLWAWLAVVPLAILGQAGEPYLEPLFNKFEPLSLHHADLVAELQKVVARTGTHIPAERMFLMKASEKTNGLNAYVSGFGATQRIVVWDTTAGRIPNDEVLFIFGHESGHYVLHHIPQMLAGSLLMLFVIFWSCYRLARWIAARYAVRWGLDTLAGGAENPLATRAGFVILLFAITLGSTLLDPLANSFSRHYEHEADVYGQEAIHGLVADPQQTTTRAFQHLGEAWLEDPAPAAFIEFWLYNHPSTLHRANFAQHYDPWANGGRGQFFAQ